MKAFDLLCNKAGLLRRWLLLCSYPSLEYWLMTAASCSAGDTPWCYNDFHTSRRDTNAEDYF